VLDIPRVKAMLEQQAALLEPGDRLPPPSGFGDPASSRSGEAAHLDCKGLVSYTALAPLASTQGALWDIKHIPVNGPVHPMGGKLTFQQYVIKYTMVRDSNKHNFTP
jgi:hypothetical protein